MKLLKVLTTGIVMASLLIAVGRAGPPLLSTGGDPGGARDGDDYPIRPVSFTKVRLADHFWLPRQETNRRVTIPHSLRQLTKAHSFDGFEVLSGARAFGVAGGVSGMNKS